MGFEPTPKNKVDVGFQAAHHEVVSADRKLHRIYFGVGSKSSDVVFLDAPAPVASRHGSRASQKTSDLRIPSPLPHELNFGIFTAGSHFLVDLQ